MSSQECIVTLMKLITAAFQADIKESTKLFRTPKHKINLNTSF